MGKPVIDSKLLVGNIPVTYSEPELKALFEQAGAVISVSMSMDRTGRALGFATVEMQTAVQADEAVKLINGTTIDGRNIAVNRSHPQEKFQRR